MTQKDLQEFINFITRSKNLSKTQLQKRNLLWTREFSSLSNLQKSKENIVNNTNINQETQDAEVSTPSIKHSVSHRPGVASTAKYFSPKNIQKFLSEYNQDEVLKYTCHLIDADEVIASINTACETDSYDYLKHSALIQEHFLALLERYKKQNLYLSPNIITLICVYLTGKNLKGERKKWSANKIEYGWGGEGIIEWATQNPHLIPNPGPNIVQKQKSSGYSLTAAFLSETTGVRIKSFSQLVIFFKSQFHIRNDNSLRMILTHANHKWEDSDVKITFSPDRFNENIQLFTDVDKLIQAYIKIIDMCIENKESEDPAQIELSFFDELETNSTYFEIHHQNSCYKKSLKNSIERIGESQSLLIMNQINGLCDLYVEAIFSDQQCAVINLWDKDALCYKPIENTSGVKYILKF